MCAIYTLSFTVSIPSFISYFHPSQYTRASGTLFSYCNLSLSAIFLSDSETNSSNPLDQFSNMADQTNNYDANFFSNLDLDEFDPEFFSAYDMELDSTPNEVGFEDGSGFPNNTSNEFETSTPLQNFGQAATSLFPDFPQESAPMQQPYNPSPFDFTSNRATTTSAPPPGTHYHPDIGWYTPAPNPFGAAPMPAQHQTTTFNDVPVAESTPSSGPSRPSTNKNKRKYGPSVYGEEQAKRRATGDASVPRPVSGDSVDYHYQGRNTKQKSGTTSKPKKRSPAVEIAGRMKELKQATLGRCRCPAAKAAVAQHISRPRNEFIIFRNDFSAEYRTSKDEKRGNANTHISTAAGEKWKEIKQNMPDVLAEYRRRAAAEAKEHAEMYPDYAYQPLKLIQAKFGQPTCKCGAYNRNAAELERLRKQAPTPENNFMATIGGDTGKEDDYVMPCTRSQSRANSLVVQAPIPQTTPFNFDFSYVDESGNMPQFDFSLQSQNYEGENAYVPPVTRRSTRIGQRANNLFVEVSDDEEESDEDEDVEMANTPPRKKHRPAPISTSRNASLTMSDFANDGFDGPASRTRSKSVSFDEGMFLEASPTNSLFGDFAEEDVGENIVIAMPVTGTSNVSLVNRSGLALPITQTRTTRSRSRGSR